VRRWGAGDPPRRVQPFGRPCGAPCGLDAAGGICEEGAGRGSARNDTRWQTGKLNLIFLLFGPTFGVHLTQPSRLKQAYDFPSYYRLVRELQPNAVIVSKGPDVRWVGNEAGIARESEWSVIPLPTTVEDYDWPDLCAPDLGSRERLKGAKTLHWYPAVCDVSVGPDWFWDPRWDRELKSLDQPKRIYEFSVGRNAGLLLNIGPDSRGLIPDSEVRRLKDFGDWIRTSFSTNLLAGVELKLHATHSGNQCGRGLRGAIWQSSDLEHHRASGRHRQGPVRRALYGRG